MTKTNQNKRDCRTNEIITPGTKYRTLYRGTTLECHAIVRYWDASMRADVETIGGELPAIEIAE